MDEYEEPLIELEAALVLLFDDAHRHDVRSDISQHNLSQRLDH